MNNLKELQVLGKDFDILYVEDNTTLRLKAEKFLKKFFRKVTLAEDGLTGLEKFRNHHYNKTMVVVFIHNFSKFNKLKGWQNGNELLKDIGNMLVENLNLNLVFRIMGDDFILLSKEIVDMQRLNNILEAILDMDILSFEIKEINLQNQHIEKLTDITILQTGIFQNSNN